MKKTTLKAGQLVTILGTVYRIKKATDDMIQICPSCDMRHKEFLSGCYKHCYRRLGSRLPMRHYYEKV